MFTSEVCHSAVQCATAGYATGLIAFGTTRHSGATDGSTLGTQHLHGCARIRPPLTTPCPQPANNRKASTAMDVFYRAALMIKVRSMTWIGFLTHQGFANDLQLWQSCGERERIVPSCLLYASVTNLINRTSYRLAAGIQPQDLDNMTRTSSHIMAVTSNNDRQIQAVYCHHWIILEVPSSPNTCWGFSTSLTHQVGYVGLVKLFLLPNNGRPGFDCAVPAADNRRGK